MQKEIFEQPIVVAQTLQSYVRPFEGEVALPVADADLESVDRLTIVACGTSDHAGLVAKYWVERFARVPVDIDVASEFRYRQPALEPGGLALFISQSGETADTLAALRHARSEKQPHRRESWGLPMERIGHALARIADLEPDVTIVVPMHKNPAVRSELLPPLEDKANIIITEPLSYGGFCRLLKRASIVLTDSGGLQEEAPHLGKPVLVMRDTTERPEAIAPRSPCSCRADETGGSTGDCLRPLGGVPHHEDRACRGAGPPPSPPLSVRTMDARFKSRHKSRTTEAW